MYTESFGRLLLLVVMLGVFVGCGAPAAAPTSPETAATPAARDEVCAQPGEAAVALFGEEIGLPIGFASIAQAFATPTSSPWGTFDVRPAESDIFLSSLDDFTLAIYVGHGSPDNWTGNPDPGLVLGDSGSCLRYFVESACNSFAHGPERCGGGADVPGGYGCPGQWHWDSDGDGVVDDDGATYTNTVDGTSVTSKMRSAYARWGQAIGPDLRMACGASTEITPTNALAIWRHYDGHDGLAGKAVADAVIAGLTSTDGIALCLTRGGKTFAESPLVKDLRFDSTTNSDPEEYFHLQYSIPLSEVYTPARVRVLATTVEPGTLTSSPGCMPVLVMDPNAEVLYATTETREGEFSPAASETDYLKGDPADGYIDAALQFIASPGIPEEQRSPDQDAGLWETWTEPYLDNKESEGNGGTGEEVPYVYGIRLMLAVISEIGLINGGIAPDVTQKSVIINFPRRIGLGDEFQRLVDLGRLDSESQAILEQSRETVAELNKNMGAPGVDRTRYPLINMLDGSNIELQMNGKSDIMNATKYWPGVVDVADFRSVLSPAEAFAVALKEFPSGADQYRLDSWNWGYASSNEYWMEREVAYSFYFVGDAETGATAAEYPPQYRLVRAHSGDRCANP